MQPTTQTLAGLIDSVFASKPTEKVQNVLLCLTGLKRELWLTTLINEEYDTVEALREASDAAWASLPLPLAIKDVLHKAVCSTPAQPEPSAVDAPTKGDTRPLTQLDVIVFDISASMNSKSCDPENTRLGAAKILFHTMCDKLVGHECPHALGLVLFGERLRVLSNFFVLIPGSGFRSRGTTNLSMILWVMPQLMSIAQSFMMPLIWLPTKS